MNCESMRELTMKAVSIILLVLLIEAFVLPVYSCQTYEEATAKTHCQITKCPVRPISTPGHSVQNYVYVPREKYIWEAETPEDIKIKKAIQKAQVDFGVASKEAGQLMLQHAKNYLASKKYNKTVELTNQIIKINRCFDGGIEGVSLAEVHKLKGEAMFRMKPTMIVITSPVNKTPTNYTIRQLTPKPLTPSVRRGVLLGRNSNQKSLLSKI